MTRAAIVKLAPGALCNKSRLAQDVLSTPAMSAQSDRRLSRSVARWPSRLSVRYQRFQVVDGQLVLGPLHSTLVRDVSSQGLFLAGASDLVVGSRVHLFVMLESGPVECFGEVVHD